MKKTLLLSLLFFVIISAGFAQKEKYQTLFIYNFTRYVKWPVSYNTGKFVIGVIGESPIIKQITSMANYRKMTDDSLSIIVITYGSIDEIEDCNILYISEDFVGNIEQIEAKCEQKSVLFITDSPGMAMKGSVINFIEKEGKIRFEFNAGEASSHGLVVTGSLTDQAI